jgi:hypothetical protein
MINGTLDKKDKEDTELKCYKALAVLTLSYGSETLTKMNKKTSEIQTKEMEITVFWVVTLCCLVHMY